MNFRDDHYLIEADVLPTLEKLIPQNHPYTISFGSTICHRNTGPDQSGLKDELPVRMKLGQDFVITCTLDQPWKFTFRRSAPGVFAIKAEFGPIV